MPIPIPRLPTDRPADSLLRHRSFLMMLVVRGGSTLALQIQTVTVGWQVYDLTHSPLDLGLVGFVQFLPALLLALVAGHVVDRYSRHTVIRVAQTLEAVAAATLALGTFQGWLTRDLIFCAVFVVGTARAFEQPALQAIVPVLVPTPLAPRAIALSSTASQSAIIAGPALGGLIYAIGPQVDYTVCAILYLVASTLSALITIRGASPIHRRFSLETLLAGIAYIRAQPVILGAMSLDLFAVLLGGATALLPVYARDILFIGPLGLGLLRSAPAVGAVASSMFLARRSIERHAGWIMLGAVASFGLMTIVFALSRSVWLSFAALIALGASDSISVVIRQTMVQLQTPDGMRGRVSAVHSLFVGTSNTLGEFESGVTAAWFGAVPAVLIGGMGTLVIVALWMRLFPGLMKFERLVPKER